MDQFVFPWLRLRCRRLRSGMRIFRSRLIAMSVAGLCHETRTLSGMLLRLLWKHFTPRSPRRRRMTLLLAPLGSGNTTLLLALAGRVDKSLRANGKVTFNGLTYYEFVPQRTAVHISQRDLHVGQMTVGKTLGFSAKCQGVGTRCELLGEISWRGKEAGIYPEPDVDVVMKMTAISGQQRICSACSVNPVSTS